MLLKSSPGWRLADSHFEVRPVMHHAQRTGMRACAADASDSDVTMQQSQQCFRAAFSTMMDFRHETILRGVEF